MHEDSHLLAGRDVSVHPATPFQLLEDGATFRLEDWWDRVTGSSWQTAKGNPAAVGYAIRAGLNNLPMDDEVVYGKVGHLGYLVHVSELGEIHE